MNSNRKSEMLLENQFVEENLLKYPHVIRLNIISQFKNQHYIDMFQF